MSALSDRLVHFKVQASASQWIEWAIANNIASEVVTFIKVKPEYLTKGSAVAEEVEEKIITPSPRSWQRVSNILNRTKDREKLHYIIAGIVGEVAAIEFFSVLQEVENLPDIKTLLSSSSKTMYSLLPKTISGLYGLAYALHSYCEAKEDFVNAIKVFNVINKIKDKQPRSEIVVFGMELLLGKVYEKGLSVEVGSTTEYEEYYNEVKDLTQLSLSNN